MNVFIWGGCEVVDTIPILRKKFPNYNINNLDTTSLGSLLSEQGYIADNVHEWFNKSDVKKYPFARRIHKEVVTKNYFENVPRVNKKDNYLIASFSRESEARCQFGREHITLIKQLVTEKSGSELSRLKFPEKILDILNDKRNVVTYDDDIVYRGFWNQKEDWNMQGEWGKRFAEIVTDLFEDRIHIIYTPPARRWLNKKIGFYQDIPVAGAFTHIFKNKVVNGKHFDKDSWHDVHKFQRGVHIGIKHAISRIRPYKAKLTEIKWEDIVGDDQHRLGRSPFHYTGDSIKFIAKKIAKELEVV